MELKSFKKKLQRIDVDIKRLESMEIDERLSFLREPKICLSCKKNLTNFSYICPKCNALYCKECAHISIDLENVCTICGEFIID